MKCPVDGATLTMAERSGVEIDYCPQCRGVWLDRGELDKILTRAGQDEPAPRPASFEPPRMAERPREREHDRDRDRGYDRGREYERDRDGYRPRKKESWFSEIFDF